MRKLSSSTDALHIEGSLLPAEFLQNLLELKTGHQTAADYDIPPGLNIKDEIGRYWRIAKALWADHQVRSARPDARRRSTHATLQEYLNASHAAQWGIVANGQTVRILRDNPSLTRPAYIGAELARIFEEERYADFVALWLLTHATRFGPGVGAENAKQLPILEQWRGQAQQLGERALANLRTGVTELTREMAGEYRFFHWRLAFPELFPRGGFCLLLANPPWERIKLQEWEFFSASSPKIAGAPRAGGRSRLIKAEDANLVDQRLYCDFNMANRGAKGTALVAHDIAPGSMGRSCCAQPNGASPVIPGLASTLSQSSAAR